MAQSRTLHHDIWSILAKQNCKRRQTEPTMAKPSKKRVKVSSALSGSCRRKRIEPKTSLRRRIVPSERRTYHSAEQPGALPDERSDNVQQLPETSHHNNRDCKNVNTLFPGSCVEEIKCGSHGGVYNSHEHGIVLVIPEGAVAQEKEITIEIGVTLNGPFTFPQGMHPVSPILWLCVKEESFSGFNIPVSIRIPHCLKCTTQESCNRLNFLKAAHRHSLEGAELPSEAQYHFETLQEGVGPTSFHPLQSFGTFETKHFCSLCIAAKLDESIKSDLQHCLFGAICRKGHEMCIRFAVLYMLDTCVQSTKQVFDNLYGKGAYREITPSVFRFLSNDFSPARLKISFERKLKSGWICALESSDEIEPNEVEFWQLSAEQLTMMQNSGAYPPSFAICITGGSENDILKITFSGSMHDNKLMKEFTLSSSADLQATHYTPISSSIPTTLPSCTDLMGADLDAITSVVMKRLQWDWEKVPHALQIPDDTIFEIKYDVKGIRKQIFALLQYWRDSSRNNSKEELAATLSRADNRLQYCIHEVLKVPIRQPDCYINSACTNSSELIYVPALN